MQLNAMIAVMQEAKAGKPIQWRNKCLAEHYDPDTKWRDVGSPGWDWRVCEYRVKPEPKRVYVGVIIWYDRNLHTEHHVSPDKFKKRLERLKNYYVNNVEIIHTFNYMHTIED